MSLQTGQWELSPKYPLFHVCARLQTELRPTIAYHEPWSLRYLDRKAGWFPSMYFIVFCF